MGGFDAGSLYSTLRLDTSDVLSGVKDVRAVIREVVENFQDLGRGLNYVWENIFFHVHQETTTELQRYQALTEAERIRTNQLREQYRQMQDMAGLTTRLRNEEDRAKRVQIAATNEGFRQEAEYHRRMTEQMSRDQEEYNALVAKLKKEEADSWKKYDAEIEAETRRAHDEIFRNQQMVEREITNMKRDEIAKRKAAQREEYYQFREMQNAASGLTMIGTTVSAAGALPIAGLTLAAKESMTFQDNLKKSLSIMDDVSDAMANRMSDSAKKLAEETGIDSKKIVDNFYTLKSAGLDAQESLAALPIVTKFAVASNSNLETSSRTLMSVMNGLQIEKSKLAEVANKLVVADKLAQGTAEEFAKAVSGRAAGAVRIFGRDLDETIATIMVFVKSGMSAEQARTAYVNLLRDLTQSSQKHGEVQLKVNGQMTAWKDIVYDSTGKIRPLIQVIRELETGLGGMNDKMKTDFMASINLNNARTFTTIRTLLGMSGDLSNFTNGLKTMGTAMEDVFGVRMSSKQKQLEQLEQRLNNLKMTLGDAALNGFAALMRAAEPSLKIIESIARQFNELSPAAQSATTQIIALGSGFTVATGAAMILGGQIVRITSDIIQLANTAKGAQLIESVAGIFGSGGAVGAAGLAVGAGSALFGAIVAFSQLNDQLDQMGQGNKARAGKFLLDVVNTTKDFSAAESDLNKAQKEGIVTLEQYTKLMDILKKRRTESYKEEFGGGFGLNLDPKINEMIKRKQSGLPEEDPAFADPDKAKKDRQKNFQTLGIEDVRTKLNEMRDAYKAVYSELGADQKAFVQQAISNLQWMLDNGLDPKRAQELVRSWEESWKQSEAAIKEAAKQGFNGMEVFDGKFVYQMSAEEIRSWGDAVKLREKVWQAEHQINEELIKQQREYNNVQKQIEKASKQQIDIDQKASQAMIPGDVANKINQNSRTSYLMRTIVGRDSTNDTNFKATQALSAYQELVQLAQVGAASAMDVKAAWVHATEEIAKATHDKSLLMTEEYRKLKREVEDVTKSSNSAWNRYLNDVKNTMGRAFANLGTNLLNLLLPTNKAQSDPLQPLINAFRGAFEKLGAYSDPKQALTDLVYSIKNAGDAATANAIAIKYFGDQGPLIAKQLRDGTLSAGDLQRAIDTASLSITDFEKASQQATSTVSKLWWQLANDLERGVLSAMGKSIGKFLAEHWKGLLDGVNNLIERIPLIGSAWSGVMKVLGVGADAVSGGIKAGTDIAGIAAPTLGAVTSIPGQDILDKLGMGLPGASSAAGGASSAASTGLSSTLGTVFGGISAATGLFTAITGFMQGSHMTADLQKIEKSTRYTEIATIENGSENIFTFTKATWQAAERIHDRLVDFAKYGMQVMTSSVTGPLSVQIAGGGASNISIQNLNVYANNPEQLAAQLKSLKAVNV